MVTLPVRLLDRCGGSACACPGSRQLDLRGALRRFAAGRLRRARPRFQRLDREALRRSGGDGEDIAVVLELEWIALEQLVLSGVAAELDPQPAPAVEEPEAHPREPRREPRGEREPRAVIAHAAEPGDDRQPGAGQRGEVQAFASKRSPQT